MAVWANLAIIMMHSLPIIVAIVACSIAKTYIIAMLIMLSAVVVMTGKNAIIMILFVTKMHFITDSRVLSH